MLDTLKNNSKTLIQFHLHDLSLSDKLLFSEASATISLGARIGLIGANGSGKTTLLQFLAGLISYHGCSVQSFGKVVYVPQLVLEQYRSDQTVYEYLAEHSEDWWQVVNTYEQIFKKPLDTASSLKSLSGGEIVKLNLALAFSSDPDVLLLDEPTNHLDVGALSAVAEILNSGKYTFVIVSHNISFLNAVATSIWEVAGTKLTTYGGNYDFYKSEKQHLMDAEAQSYSATKKKISKLEKSLVQANVVNAEKIAKFEKKKKSKADDLPRIMRKAVQNRGERVVSGARTKLSASIQAMQEKRATLTPPTRRLAHLELTTQTKKGLLISVTDGQLMLPDGRILIDKLNLKLYHGDRLGIMGDNGSGKTTLVKQLGYLANSLIKGSVAYGQPYKTLFVDQKYDLINPKINLLDNLRAVNPGLNYEEVRKILGNLGFITESEVTEYAGELSGGETARLAFAMATSSAADLLILDEPTNNLDIETIERILPALQNYRGAMLVISHDEAFLLNLTDNLLML